MIFKCIAAAIDQCVDLFRRQNAYFFRERAGLVHHKPICDRHLSSNGNGYFYSCTNGCNRELPAKLFCVEIGRNFWLNNFAVFFKVDDCFAASTKSLLWLLGIPSWMDAMSYMQYGLAAEALPHRRITPLYSCIAGLFNLGSPAERLNKYEIN
jgi:hypothetical protein